MIIPLSQAVQHVGEYAHVPLLQGHPGWRNYQHLRVQATVQDGQVQHPEGDQERRL